jgi:hypothetical protein
VDAFDLHKFFHSPKNVHLKALLYSNSRLSSNQATAVPLAFLAVTWANLEKRPPFPQFLSKISEFFFAERSDKSNFFLKRSKLWRAYLFD